MNKKPKSRVARARIDEELANAIDKYLHDNPTVDQSALIRTALAEYLIGNTSPAKFTIDEEIKNTIEHIINRNLAVKKTLLLTENRAAEHPPNYPAAEKPHLLAAAGTPLNGEILQDIEADNIVRVQITGRSMEPLFKDGQIIEMTHRRASRSPYMKKGLIYLVAYDGGHTVKRYNTRPPKPTEINSEYLDDHGKVRILQSINPEYPEIIITQDIQWHAWHPGK